MERIISKRLSILVVFTLLIVSTTSVLAMSIQNDVIEALPQGLRSDSGLVEVAIIAYMDTREVSIEVKDQILDAREKIAFATFEAVAPEALKNDPFFENLASNEELVEAISYAYLSLYVAPAYLVEAILEARESIIMGVRGWFNPNAIDSAYFITVDMELYNETGILEIVEQIALPEFSYLFPNWDIPMS